MFYKNKFIFFIILFVFSLVLQYFVAQQVVFIPITNNVFLLTTIILLIILLLSIIVSLVTYFVYLLIIKFIKNIANYKLKINKKFFLWLVFSITSYICTFIIFYKSISY